MVVVVGAVIAVVVCNGNCSCRVCCFVVVIIVVSGCCVCWCCWVLVVVRVDCCCYCDIGLLFGVVVGLGSLGVGCWVLCGWLLRCCDVVVCRCCVVVLARGLC